MFIKRTPHSTAYGKDYDRLDPNFGLKGEIPFLQLEGFDPIKSLPIDGMHTISGVTKHILNLMNGNAFIRQVQAPRRQPLTSRGAARMRYGMCVCVCVICACA